MKNLGSGEVVYTFHPRRQKSKEISKFKASMRQSKSEIQAWRYIPLIWATPSAGDLHKGIGKIHSLLACKNLLAHLLEPQFYRRPIETTSLVGLSQLLDSWTSHLQSTIVGVVEL